jgi:hypothetical protein
MQQDVSAVVITLQAHIEQSEECGILLDKLISQSRRLRCGIT